MQLEPVKRLFMKENEKPYEIHRFLKLFKTESGEDGSNRKRLETHMYSVFVEYCRNVYGKELNNIIELRQYFKMSQ